MSTSTAPKYRNDALPVVLDRGARSHAAALVAARKPFKSSTGNMSGVTWYTGRSGRLGHTLARLIEDQQPDYLLYSYDTPIAWHVPGLPGNGGWVVSPLRHSSTTTRHQSVAAVIIRESQGGVE